MPNYTYRCPDHGDFTVEQSMSETTASATCRRKLSCEKASPKVLGAALQFTYGRANFHDGPDGTGETVRETGQRWMSEAKAAGLNPEPAAARWV